MTTFFEQNRKYFLWAAYVLIALLLLLWLGPLIAEKKPSRLVQSTISGLLIGGIYALIALGIVIINKASGVFNFAHGWMMLLGGLIFYSFFSTSSISLLAAGGLAALTVVMAITMTNWRAILEPRNLIIAVVVTVVLTAVMSLPGRDWQYVRAIVGALTGAVLLGLVAERFTIRPLIGQPLFATVLMTLAISELLNGVTQLTWGSVEIPLQVFSNPDGSSLSTIKLDSLKDALGGTVIIQPGLLFSFGLALLAFVAFVLFFQFTNVGLAMRASAENQRLAQAIGLRVRIILAVAWAIAALLATVGGVLQGGATTLSLNMPLLALLAFPAVLLGGLESIGGALVGGLVIGLIQEWANLLFPGTQAGTELAPYVVLMIVLVIRPDGLFGQKRIERI
ncbi:MAG: branched-chain amino acid ABC transporter permease [Anaerolineae bacterium]|nr:branched-chain amino acid ABC transporter permease [Anaerolineae bacterium]